MKSSLMRIWVLSLLLPMVLLASDPVADLQQNIKSGKIKLEYDPVRGYLDSLLKTLKVPVSSQTLVFSKTSLQSERISPATPRALYFNDDVYVGWAQGASLIEIMSMDPKMGSVFYLLGQDKAGPIFERSTGHECSVCHHSPEAKKFAPRLLVSSVIPDATGSVEGTVPIQTTDQSPMSERWGGWYVTGTHGPQKHLGNTVLRQALSAYPNTAPAAAFARSYNVTDLSSRFNIKPYPTPHSDIVALMVLAHQVEVHNLMALAHAKAEAQPQETGEPLVKAMLFAGAEPLTAPVEGTSTFAKDFSALGPSDSRGRSLRDFDLKTRLFRYPLSYLIYSDAFDQLPEGVKGYVGRRFREILSGTDKSKDFAHLSAADRSAILEILKATKPNL